MHFEPLLPFERWQEIGQRLNAHSRVSAWWLGDWMVFGRFKYGRRYRAAIEATGLEYQTLRNYAVVCRRYEMSRRRYNLSFQHYAEVCSFTDDEQERLLAEAEAQRLSRSAFRRRVRQKRRIEGGDTNSYSLVRVPRASEAKWQRAAAACGESFGDWLLARLNEAADFALASQDLASLPREHLDDVPSHLSARLIRL